jgi:dCMP deaminase
MISKFDPALMDNAITWSAYSYCIRNQVGVVISIDGRSVSSGFNGTHSGEENDCEKDCAVCGGSGSLMVEYGTDACWRCKGDGLDTNDDITNHGEINAIDFADENGINIVGGTMHITLAPCLPCARRIHKAGLIRVQYLTPYKNTEGVDFLKSNGIVVDKYEAVDYNKFFKSKFKLNDEVMHSGTSLNTDQSPRKFTIHEILKDGEYTIRLVTNGMTKVANGADLSPYCSKQ